ncbi:MAG: hypothetical protein QOE90_2672 [Thermoplasmata archaeon]|jgi:hypothetical protein|nr:hypothetical protein [Thermoplasmata archaeon]
MSAVRTRAWALPTGLALLLLGVPAAQAAEAWARADPAQAAPGATVRLVFVVNGSGLLDVAVERGVTCTLEGPNASRAQPCEGAPQLVDVGVLPAGHAYAWEFAAPAAPGNYTVRVQRADLLALPGDGASAEATFTVAPAPADPVSLDSTGHDGGVSAAREASFFGLFALFGAAGGAGAAAAGLAGSDAARWLASLSAGTGTLLVTLFVVRLGGRP